MASTVRTWLTVKHNGRPEYQLHYELSDAHEKGYKIDRIVLKNDLGSQNIELTWDYIRTAMNVEYLGRLIERAEFSLRLDNDEELPY